MTPNLALYGWMDRLPWPRSYPGKFLFTAFLGVHLPLITVILWIVFRDGSWANQIPVLIVTLAATLAGTLFTIYVQQQLLAPVLRTSTALGDYLRDRTIPDLPQQYEDEAGVLMSDARECITHLDQLIRLKGELLGIISHDTRGPMTSVQLANSLSQSLMEGARVEGEDLAELREMSVIIADATRQQLEIMNGILEIARADAGAIDVTRGTVSARALVEAALAGAKLPAREKSIHLAAGPIDDGDRLL
ncbi:MAG TPA: histidine kinase dimerization/phospho-acceptor domain-containing protein, partial [Longimicrobium sp.]